ncbi:PAS domain-containing protein, partial [Aliarcobacter butzleri]|uniref:PAS domain-containing protein n=1 Tax=Aliarcobacter butzleri TaxID=28197 RepID=UPI001EDC37D5
NKLIGKPHSIVRHKDMPKLAFRNLWETIQKGEIWTGFVKNSTKNGGYYWVYATIYPFESCDGQKGYLSCRRKATQEEIIETTKLYENLKKEENQIN